MPELRWTLLVVGALFVAALALWELRRQRQAPRSNLASRGREGVQSAPPGPGARGQSESADRAAPMADGGSDAMWARREPTLTLPVLHAEPRAEHLGSVSAGESHVTEKMLAVEQGLAGAHPSSPRFAPSRSPPFIPPLSDSTPPPGEVMDEQEEFPPDPVTAASAAPAFGSAHHALAAEPRDEGDGDSDGEPGERAPDNDYVETPAPASLAAGAFVVNEPVVEWPREESRRIVALRLVSGPTDRFPGRVVRQALAAEGFVLGRFDIFHKPGPDARAVLSVASLTKPGTFALSTMDAQRFGGLSLFAVLPGPLPAQQAFDALLSAARALNERLQGALQDERGEPLTPVRSANIRDSLANVADAAAQHLESPP